MKITTCYPLGNNFNQKVKLNVFLILLHLHRVMTLACSRYEHTLILPDQGLSTMCLALLTLWSVLKNFGSQNVYVTLLCFQMTSQMTKDQNFKVL